jgi:dihydroorotate dehydrogenase (NAD+) catalytic subunit
LQSSSYDPSVDCADSHFEPSWLQLSVVPGGPITGNRLVPRLDVSLGRLRLKNPFLVASGTFGYAREMQAYVDFAQLGGIIPKTVTPLPRSGNPPPRTVETSSGLLNSIGLDNDGLDVFIAKHLEALLGLGTSIIANIAGKNTAEFVQMARKLNDLPRLAALELNISCPNVSGGVDYGTNPSMTAEVVSAVRAACDLPVIAKLTPNVTSVVEIARAASDAGADALSLVNTFQGLAVNWRKRKPVLGNGIGGLSGPAIKPLALRIVWQVAQAVKTPIIGVGGIQSIDDVMEFLVCGASAIQIGTANFYNPSLATSLVSELDAILTQEGCESVEQIVGTLQPSTVVLMQKAASCTTSATCP